MDTDINFIKWMVEYANDFENDGDFIRYKKTKDYFLEEHIFMTNNVYWSELYYPLLIQRAIEGINREKGIYLITQNFANVWIEHNICDDFEEYFSFSDYESIDKAKEQALKYIFEQETE